MDELSNKNQESTNRVSISKNDPLIKRTKFLMNMKSNP